VGARAQTGQCRRVGTDRWGYGGRRSLWRTSHRAGTLPANCPSGRVCRGGAVTFYPCPSGRVCRGGAVTFYPSKKRRMDRVRFRPAAGAKRRRPGPSSAAGGPRRRGRCPRWVQARPLPKARVRARAGCAAMPLSNHRLGGHAFARGAGQPASEAKGHRPVGSQGSVTLLTIPGRSDQTVPAQ